MLRLRRITTPARPNNGIGTGRLRLRLRRPPEWTIQRRNAWAYGAILWFALAGAADAIAADDDQRGWGDPCRPADDRRSVAIHELYEQRDQTPVWLTHQGRTSSGQRLIHLLDSAEDGVATDCLEQALSGRGDRYSRGALDVLLTDAYLALSNRRLGADSSLHDHLAALGPGRQEQLQQQLDRLASSASVRDKGAHPSATASESERMAQALERYRRIAARGGWPEIGNGASLERGTRDPRVPALRERLAATGDLAQANRANSGKRYDAELVQAVIAFQKRHGLEPDGVVGSATRKALNVSAEQRVERIEINLRRIEANAIEGRQPILRVNIPDYRITLHETEGVSFSTRAIVGQPDHETPQMQTYITALTLNPAWYVPRSIVRDDLAHRFARQDGYAERNGFHAVNSERSLDELDWSESPAVAVRQEPGPANALGRIKFEMPNRQAIYLHDTPAKHLFASRQRAFSAGCVRVEEPIELASRLTGLARDRLERMAQDGATRTLRLGWRIPVQLVYFTAWVDADGRVQFRPDIYDRDAIKRTASR